MKKIIKCYSLDCKEVASIEYLCECSKYGYCEGCITEYYLQDGGHKDNFESDWANDLLDDLHEAHNGY